jgi:hypothetical protein
MELTEYILKNEHAFWIKQGKKIFYSAGSKLLVEEEVMSTNNGLEYRHYFVYSKPNVLLGYYDKEEFFEIFMTLEEARDKKIDDII